MKRRVIQATGHLEILCLLCFACARPTSSPEARSGALEAAKDHPTIARSDPDVVAMLSAFSSLRVGQSRPEVVTALQSVLEDTGTNSYSWQYPFRDLLPKGQRTGIVEWTSPRQQQSGWPQ